MDMGDGEELPFVQMNCPHHIQVLKHHVHSYRDTIRIAERMMQSHEIWCPHWLPANVREMSPTTVTSSLLQNKSKKNSNALQLIIDVYKDFNLTEYCFRLSSWPSRYWCIPWQRWDVVPNHASAAWRNGRWLLWSWRWGSLLRTKIGYSKLRQLERRNPFYYPAWLLVARTLRPLNIGADGEEQRPVERFTVGLFPTMERFTAILIENYKGALLPTWLALIPSNPHPRF